MVSANDQEGPATRMKLPPDVDWPTVTSIPRLVKLLDGAISESSLYERARMGALPGCRRVGHRFLIFVPTFIAYLQAGTGDEPKQSE